MVVILLKPLCIYFFGVMDAYAENSLIFQHLNASQIEALWRHMVTRNRVNIGTGNGLLPDGAKSLPEPMLTYIQQCPVVFIWGHYHNKIWRYQSVKQDEKISQGQMSQQIGVWTKPLTQLLLTLLKLFFLTHCNDLCFLTYWGSVTFLQCYVITYVWYM